jgi:hypothetical protein
MPPKAGTAAASAVKICSVRSAEKAASVTPAARASRPTISQSGRAAPTGASAVRKRWTRPWKLVNVPSRSTYAALGSTQCARWLVALARGPWNTTVLAPARAAVTSASGSAES